MQVKQEKRFSNEDSHEDSEEYKNDDQFESDDQEIADIKPRRQQKVKSQGLKDKMWVVACDEDGNVIEDKPKKARKLNKIEDVVAVDENGNELPKLENKKKRKVAAPKELKAGVIKSSNKLIGEIENRDLYASDDDVLPQKQYEDTNIYRGQDIEFGGRDREKKEIGTLFQRINIRKQLNENSSSHVTNLGFVQHLSTKISENELAAKGIKMSVKQDLLLYIKGMDAPQ